MKKIKFSALMLLRPLIFITMQMGLAAGFMRWTSLGGGGSLITQSALRIVLRLLVFGTMQVAMFAGFRRMGKPDDLSPLNKRNWRDSLTTLGLSDQQSARLQDLEKNMYDKTRDIQIELMDALFYLRQLGLQKDADPSSVEAKIKEINELRKQLHSAKQEEMQQLKSILTPKQLKKLAPGNGAGFHGPGRRMGNEA